MELIIISILATLIIVLVTIVLWFASRNRKLKDDKDNRVIEVALKLEESHNRLDKAVMQIVANTNANLELCKERHKLLNHVVSDYADAISVSEKKIQEIEIRLAKINGK